MPRPTSSLLPALLLAASCATSAPPLPPADPPPAVVVAPEPRSARLLAESRALREAGDSAAAAARLDEALALDPACDPLRLELAELLVAEGRDLERVAALLAEVRHREADARFDLVSAHLAELRGDDAAAEAAYGRALLVADDADVRVRRALALDRLGRDGEARGELERVRALRPGDLLARSRLAELYEAEGRLAEAEAELVAAARAAPERAGSWTRLARFYERARKPRAAREADARAREVSGREDRALRPLLRSRR